MQWLGCLHIAGLGLGILQAAEWGVKMSQSKSLPVHSVVEWENIKELIWMKAKEAGLTSLHVFIKSTWPESKTGKWKQCSLGQIHTELCRCEMESEIPTSLGEKKEKEKERALKNVSHKQSL